MTGVQPAHDTLLTELEAAERVGWTPACLRSHRERHALGQLAERLPEPGRAAVRALAAADGRLAGLPLLAMEPWRLTACESPDATVGEDPWRAVGHRQRLNARGREVARWLKFGPRPTVPPPHVVTEEGVRYREADVAAWLDAHPAALDRDELLEEHEVAERLGLESGSLKTLRYRARQATAELSTLRPATRRPGETAAEYETRTARIAHLERVADSAPLGAKVGRVYRYRAEDVEAWRVRHPERLPHPLLAKRDTARGRLLTAGELARRMRIEPQSLIGYRYRAGAAARRLAGLSSAERRKGEPAKSALLRLALRARLERLADCVPPHVLVRGRPRYQILDVREWERRQERRAAARGLPPRGW
jgi:hypothetical protein